MNTRTGYSCQGKTQTPESVTENGLKFLGHRRLTDSGDIKTVINPIDENEDLGLNNWIFFYEEFVPISLTSACPEMRFFIGDQGLRKK